MDSDSRILIVDDEPRMTDSIKANLEGRGFGIDTCNQATEALDLLQESAYDVALLDVKMPGLSGFDLLDALDRDRVETVFIIMTGDASLESAIEAVRKGASDYIRKPFDSDELFIRVNNALKQKQLQDERKQFESEKLLLEKQLRQSQKMEAIGTLAGGIAHDFNNILSIILGNTELAKAVVPEWNEARENLEKILTASNRAKELINQLLSFTRQTEYERKPLELKSIITESLKLLRASLPSNIVMRQDVPQASLTVRGDSTQIHQIMMNLCTNAAHAMEENGGVLEVKLETATVVSGTVGNTDLEPGPYVVIRVADTGHGIDPAIRDRIFDPYFTTKEPGKGTGMGLAVVHGIVKNHGGAIEIFSRPNVKTEFQVYLPIVRAEETQPESVVTTAMPTGGERILLVDDEAMIVDIVTQMLVKLGYEVEASTDSRNALDMFRQDPERYDVVLTDMTMPHLTGKQLAEQLQDIKPGIPIILCSGFNENMDRADALELGIAEFAMKPLGIHQLAQIIRKAIDRPAVERRKDKRFKAETGAFVISRADASARGELLDVSMTGLSFKYDKRAGSIDGVDEVTISTADKQFVVDGISCKTVSDIETNGDTDPTPAARRRRGMKFEDLTRYQRDQLGCFIENHTREIAH